MTKGEQTLDQWSRPIRDLRISVTDQCNFRCTYCMPKEIFGSDYKFLSQVNQLSFTEITRLASIFVSLGVNKIRLTGGEPLLRKDLEKLIKKLTLIDGVEDIGLTTNGVLLGKHAKKLWDAGLRRLNISLDALEPALFGKINDRGYNPKHILENIDYVNELGFEIKINMVVQKGINDREIIPMASYFKEKRITLRFIEFMDVGNDNEWDINKVMSKKEIKQLLDKHFELKTIEPTYFGEVAKLYKYKNDSAYIGFITSISDSFCSTCTRARLSSDGKLYTCLFASQGYNLRELMRSGCSDKQLYEKIKTVWENRSDRYSDERLTLSKLNKRKINMSYIGG